MERALKIKLVSKNLLSSPLCIENGGLWPMRCGLLWCPVNEYQSSLTSLTFKHLLRLHFETKKRYSHIRLLEKGVWWLCQCTNSTQNSLQIIINTLFLQNVPNLWRGSRASLNNVKRLDPKQNIKVVNLLSQVFFYPVLFRFSLTTLITLGYYPQNFNTLRQRVTGSIYFWPCCQ